MSSSSAHLVMQRTFRYGTISDCTPRDSYRWSREFLRDFFSLPTSDVRHNRERTRKISSFLYTVEYTPVPIKFLTVSVAELWHRAIAYFAPRGTECCDNRRRPRKLLLMTLRCTAYLCLLTLDNLDLIFRRVNPPARGHLSIALLFRVRYIHKMSGMCNYTKNNNSWF